MMVILLAGTVDEAKAHAKLAGLASADVLIPRTSRALGGLVLSADDLIIEFPSWRAQRNVPDARRHEVERTLERSIRKSGVPIQWEKIGSRQ